MTLQEKLDTFKAQFESGAPPYNTTPEIVQTMHRATNELRNSGILDRVLKSVTVHLRSSCRTRKAILSVPRLCLSKDPWW